MMATENLPVFQTTDSIAELIGVTSATGRNRVMSGEWKPDAQTSSGKALFSPERAQEIVERELQRRDERANDAG